MTESEFSEHFRQFMPIRVDGCGGAGSRLIVPEVDGPVRRADYVEVQWKAARPPSSATIGRLACFRHLATSRVYCALRLVPDADVAQLCEATGYTTSTVKTRLAELHDLSWVCAASKDRFRVSRRGHIPAFHLATYELKLTDWRRACRQLLGHMLFADRVVLVMPQPARTTTAAAIVEELSHYPASLVFVDDCNPTIALWKDVDWAQDHLRLCALGKVCAQTLLR